MDFKKKKNDVSSKLYCLQCSFQRNKNVLVFSKKGVLYVSKLPSEIKLYVLRKSTSLQNYTSVT